MKWHRQPGSFDIGERTTQRVPRGDPLAGLKARIHWEAFRSGLNWVQALFDRFHPQLAEHGYAARAEQRTGDLC